MKDRRVLPKWAQEEMARIELDRDLAAAFVRTPLVTPDVLPPTGVRCVKGFTFNAYRDSVLHSISSSSCHATDFLDNGTCKETTTQRPIKQYSSKLLAAKALRCQVEKECAIRLMRIDKMISEFENEEAE